MATVEVGEEIRIIRTREGWKYHIQKKGVSMVSHGAPFTNSLDEAFAAIKKLVEE